MKYVYVVAHTESQHHVDGLVGGWYDSVLTARGRMDAAAIGRRLRELIPEGEPVEIHSSDLLRARETAEAIATVLAVPVFPTAGLREKSYGEAEGRPQAWLDERFVFAPKLGERMEHRDGIAGAENKREFATRIYHAIETILERSCERQVIVTHGFALTFVVAAWIKMPLDSAGYINIRSSSGGISQLVEDDTFHNRAIVSVNDTSHLAPWVAAQTSRR